MNLKSKIALAVLALTAGSAAMAQMSYNVGAVSEYRYRGLNQTASAPALQGGLDYASAGGFYVGAWVSQIRWIKEAGAKGDVELDLYGGYKGAITKDLAFDVGFLRYEYVGNTLADVTNTNASTNEVYGALTYGPVTFKYSYALSDLFGTFDSKGSTYADLSATFDLGSGFSVVPHVGRQEIAGASANKPFSYTDYSVTLSKDLGNGLSASIAAIATNADETLWTVNGRHLGKSVAVVGVKYAF